MKIQVVNRHSCPFFFATGTKDPQFHHCRLAELYTDDPIECEGLDSFNCFLDRYKEVIVVKNKPAKKQVPLPGVD